VNLLGSDTLGGTTPGARNVISGNHGDGSRPETIAFTDLVLSGSGPTADQNPGAGGTFTLTVIHAGTNDAYGVTLNELFPEGGPLRSATASRGIVTFTTDGNFVVSLGTLHPGDSATVTFRTSSSGASGGEFVANVLLASLTPDVEPVDNSLVQSVAVSEAVAIPTATDLSLTATASPDPAVVGGIETYVLTASDLGPGPANHIALFYTLANQVVPVSASPSQGRASRARTAARPGVRSRASEGRRISLGTLHESRILTGRHDPRLPDTYPETIDQAFRIIRLRFLVHLQIGEHRGHRLLENSPIFQTP